MSTRRRAVPWVLLSAMLAWPWTTGEAVADERIRGRELFERACAGCHSVETPRAETDWSALAARSGPSLASAGSRFRSGWISAWLVEPRPVRPAGFLPSRHTVVTSDGDKIDPASLPSHPAVSPEEAVALEAYLAALELPEVPYPVAEPSSAIRASVHFEKLLPCGGCHRAEPGVGGVSGPDLTHVAERLRPGWVRSVLWDPLSRGLRLMPKTSLRADQLSALAAFLEETKTAVSEVDASFLLESDEAADRVPAPDGRGATIYRLLCSQCHGVRGDGRGINAPYLFVAPRDHTSYEEMSRLSDEQIRRAIERGGAAVGKSTAMPAWGALLRDDDVRLLVAYLRSLSGTESR